MVKEIITLNNGIPMPTLGFGVYRIPDGRATEEAVGTALEVGYRLIDTAKFYGNEASVGRAVRESGIAREDIFVTTKLWPTDFLDPAGAFERSFAKLDLVYIDLYLVHFPIPYVPRNVWKTLERLYTEKRVRAIGVSNYNAGQLEGLLSWCTVPPAVNQIRFNPFSFKRDTLEFCNTHGIRLEAHTPLAEGNRMHHPAIQEVAQAVGRSPAQVMIRWALQMGAVVIPKSVRKERVVENRQVYDFELTPTQMDMLSALS